MGTVATTERSGSGRSLPYEGRSPASSVRTATTWAFNDMAGRSVSPMACSANASCTDGPGR